MNYSFIDDIESIRLCPFYCCIHWFILLFDWLMILIIIFIHSFYWWWWWYSIHSDVIPFYSIHLLIFHSMILLFWYWYSIYSYDTLLFDDTIYSIRLLRNVYVYCKYSQYLYYSYSIVSMILLSSSAFIVCLLLN